jgi:hypothetical protein
MFIAATSQYMCQSPNHPNTSSGTTYQDSEGSFLNSEVSGFSLTEDLKCVSGMESEIREKR